MPYRGLPPRCMLLSLALAAMGLSWVSCGGGERGADRPEAPGQGACRFESDELGSEGGTRLNAEVVITGLEVPWAIGFLPNGNFLVTERPGRVRLVRGGALVAEPVLKLTVGEGGEGGLMGLAVDPDFDSNRRFYVYYTEPAGGSNENRLERYRLADDEASAVLERTLVDGIPAGTFHNGGRIRFGPDGALYVATGDARSPEFAQDPASRAGKILRVATDSGEARVHVSGVRNVQGFDWWSGSRMIVSDHGPTGELGLNGRDEISVAGEGDNLGWPTISACEERDGLVTPFLSWNRALPPGGLVVYDGDLVPSFRNDILVTGLGARHLHRIRPDGSHEVYLSGRFGRLRDIVVGPDGALWITTSNCDGRGSCDEDRDAVIRVTERG